MSADVHRRGIQELPTYNGPISRTRVELFDKQVTGRRTLENDREDQDPRTRVTRQDRLARGKGRAYSTSEQSGLWTRMATESVSLCAAMRN